MSIAQDPIGDQALALPVDLRIALVEKLLDSLNASTQPDIDAAWAEEAERRIDQVDRGEVETISGDEVLRKVREGLAR
jgi:putative addiction module component (TIGR02574 family)